MLKKLKNYIFPVVNIKIRRYGTDMNINNKVFEQLSIADLKEALRRKENVEVQRLESKIVFHTKKIEEYHDKLCALGRRTSSGKPLKGFRKNTRRPKDGLTIRQIIHKVLKNGQLTSKEIVVAANKAGLIAGSGAKAHMGNISAIISQNPDDFKAVGNGKWAVCSPKK